MPGRRGQGRGRGFRGKRSRGSGITRFLEPCLLLLISNKTQHGYELLDGLKTFDLDVENLDPSVVYRMLRQMEDDGYVQSDWDTSGTGPPRRVYQITDQGMSYLDFWVDDLKRLNRMIIHFLETAEKK